MDQNISMNANVKKISELFYRKVFRIPDYQRSYAWEQRNWQDFWEDIKDGISTHTDHFWGTITLKNTGKKEHCEEEVETYEVHEIVDGQQRITTLYLFLKALSMVDSTLKNKIEKEYIKCGNIFRLVLGNADGNFLKSIIDGSEPSPQTKGQRLVKGALEFFKNNIIPSSSGITGRKIFEYIKDITFGLEFIVLEDTIAIKIFETLNDRGKLLTVIDKTKSFLMFYSSKFLNGQLNSNINTIFGNIFRHYDYIKEEGEKLDVNYIKSNKFSEEELLRYFYYYFAEYAKEKYNLKTSYDYDIRTDEVFDTFIKESCGSLKLNTKNLQMFMDELTEDFGNFVETFKNTLVKCNTMHRYRKLFPFLGLNTRLYPLVVGLLKENILDDNFLQLIESTDIRIFKIKNTDPRKNLYQDVIAQIKKGVEKNTLFGSLHDFVTQFMDDNRFETDLNGNLYKNPAVKYILWEHEKYVNPKFDDGDYDLYKFLQVEHIFSRTPSFDTAGYGFIDSSDYEKEINRVGNLTLFRPDSSNEPPNAKATNYQQAKLHTTRQLGASIKNKGFDKKRIEERTQEIVEFCVTKWPA